MAEKIHPASKSSSTTSNPTFPTTKAQLYNHSRPVYRPQPRQYRRTFCCSCCLYITFTFILLLAIACAVAGAMYVFYRPHRPTFTVSRLHVIKFKLTSNKLTTKFNFTVTVGNPNKRIVFDYDPVSVTFISNDVDVGDGLIPAFTNGKRNTTSLRTVVSTSGQSVDDDKSGLKLDVKSKKSVLLKIQLDTKVKAKIGMFKTKKVPIRVTCEGINAVVPADKTATTTAAVISNKECKVDLRIKIWKWTV